MAKKTINIFILCLMVSEITAIDTNSIKYCPLNLGSIYVYTETITIFPHTTITTRKSLIQKDTIINNHKYFYCSNFPSRIYSWCRTDSLTGSLYRYDTSSGCSHINPYDKLIDSLGFRNSYYLLCGQYYSCDGEQTINLFGFNTSRLPFSTTFGQGAISWSYVKNFGLYSSHSSSAGGSYTATLKGCVINGIVYGDTSMPVGINKISTEIPINFSLSQNYPNPFNPSTKIKFDIPKTSFTKLIIYDQLGRELTALVNEELKPGTYEVECDASNFTSGIYFYRITAGDFIETKKMILIK